jgi:hypothetical protein
VEARVPSAEWRVSVGINGFSVYVINVQVVRSTAPRDAYNSIPSPSLGGFKAVLELDRSFEHDLRNPIL